jgi:xanthine permease XanP
VSRFYGVNDTLPWPWALALGSQHLLGMFVGIVTPPLILAQALSLDSAQTAYLVSVSLFTSGLTTALQVHRIGPLGSGLLSVTGPSFAFVPIAISTAQAGGLDLVFGVALAGAFVPMLVAWSLPAMRRLFPPLVTGIAITLIGVTLIQVGFQQMAGGLGHAHFGSPHNFGLGFLVVGTIIAVQSWGRGWMRNVSIAVGLLVGYVVAALSGDVDFSPVLKGNWLHVPRPLMYGLEFRAEYLLPWLIAYLLVALECIGDITATSAVSREPVEGPLFEQRLRGGLLADSLGCMLCSLFHALPKTTFAQNNGLIAMTGVASRQVGLVTALLLSACGLFPKLAALVSQIPPPVLGGATFLMFSTMAGAGLQIALGSSSTPRDRFILAISLGLGLGVHSCPAALEPLHQGHQAIKVVLESGMAVGTLAAATFHAILPEGQDFCEH